MDDHGFVLDIPLQRHRNTEAARTFLTKLLREFDVPEATHVYQFRRYGVAIREIPSLTDVDRQQVTSTAKWNNVTEQEH